MTNDQEHEQEDRRPPTITRESAGLFRDAICSYWASGGFDDFLADTDKQWFTTANQRKRIVEDYGNLIEEFVQTEFFSEKVAQAFVAWLEG